MGRKRCDAICEYGNGTVWVKHSRRGVGYSIFVRTPGGTREYTRPTLEQAQELGSDLGIRYGYPCSGDHLHVIISHFLAEKKSSDWKAEGSALNAEQICRKWFSPLYFVAGRDLQQNQVDGIVKAIRDAGNSPRYERKVMGLWQGIIEFGRRTGAIPLGLCLTPSIKLRTHDTIRMSGDDGRIIRRSELPTWEQIRALAVEAATTSGRWWHELLVLFLATVGLRFGEAASLTGDSFDLLTHQVTIDWALRDPRSGGMYEKPYTKNGTVRATSWPSPLDEMVARRLSEIGPRELVFPGKNKGSVGPSNVSGLDHRNNPRFSPERADVIGTFASVGWWRDKIFIPAGVKAGWPIKHRCGDGKVTSLAWHPHDLRHYAATWMLAPRDPDPALWWRGVGLAAIDVANALGDTVETILRIYVGESSESQARVREALRWDGTGNTAQLQQNQLSQH